MSWNPQIRVNGGPIIKQDPIEASNNFHGDNNNRQKMMRAGILLLQKLLGPSLTLQYRQLWSRTRGNVRRRAPSVQLRHNRSANSVLHQLSQGNQDLDEKVKRINQRYELIDALQSTQQPAQKLSTRKSRRTTFSQDVQKAIVEVRRSRFSRLEVSVQRARLLDRIVQKLTSFRLENHHASNVELSHRLSKLERLMREIKSTNEHCHEFAVRSHIFIDEPLQQQNTCMLNSEQERQISKMFEQVNRIKNNIQMIKKARKSDLESHNPELRSPIYRLPGTVKVTNYTHQVIERSQMRNYVNLEHPKCSQFRQNVSVGSAPIMTKELKNEYNTNCHQSAGIHEEVVSVGSLFPSIFYEAEPLRQNNHIDHYSIRELHRKIITGHNSSPVNQMNNEHHRGL